jgi:hypothetical protein
VARVRLALDLLWKDEFLVWNASVSKKEKITRNSSQIWIPDIMIGNNRDYGMRLVERDFGDVIINNDGRVWAWPYINCDIRFSADITKYPFDKQELEIGLLSWTGNADEFQMNIPVYWDPLSLYDEDGEWSMLTHNLANFNQSFGEEKPYNFVIYTFTIQRKWLYPVLSIIAPVSLTSLINVLVFILPVAGHEKISLSISVFLTMAVFLTIANNTLPKTSQGVSFLVVYLSLQMISSVLTILFATVFVHVNYHKDKDKPSKIKLVLGRLLCCFQLKTKRQGNNLKTQGAATDDNLDNTEQSQQETRMRLELANGKCAEYSNNGDSNESLRGMDVDLKAISRTIEMFLFVLSAFWNIVLLSIFFGSS